MKWCWFAKVLRFFRIKNNSRHKIQGRASENNYCERRANKPYRELCILQCYAILKEQVISVDSIDRSLNYARLR